MTLYATLFPSGAYTPLTKEGTIMVDGVLASCYVHAHGHDLAHMAMTPVKWFPEMLKWIFGEDIEMPVYVDIAADVGYWIF